MKIEIKKKMLDKKWKRLEIRGIKRPQTAEENQRRIREAHAGSA